MRFRTTFTAVILAAVIFAALLVNAGPSWADDNEKRSLELFEKHVRPTLIDHCIRCHGPEKEQGGLRLDSRSGVIEGGDSGMVITPGDPDDSILVNAIRYHDPGLEMPPRGKLPGATIEAFEQWVQLGAVDPRTEEIGSGEDVPLVPTVAEGREFWSFQPIENPGRPPVRNTAWPDTEVDYFTLARREANGLAEVDQADPVTLIRRVYYDLIGLPPTPAQINEFVNDRSPDAYEDLIDELLGSHHFGERWGRHWLDVVRFAESSGGGRTALFPNAWRFRDYVIDAFNRDLPYDQFLKEQIAGDLLEHGDWQDQSRKMIATAFLLLGPTNYELQDKDILEMDVVDEQLDTIGKSMLGMTIGCARCHDHKFDPIPADDYYALAGILKSTKAMIHSNVSTWNKVELPLPPEEEKRVSEQELKQKLLRDRIVKTKQEIDDLEGKSKSKRTKRAANIEIETIDGIVVDDESAERIGEWTSSTSVPRYVNGKYIHDAASDKGKKQVVFRPNVTIAGDYEVHVSYTASGNRSSKVPVHIHHVDGESIVRVNQQAQPEIEDAYTSVGVFAFAPERENKIVISNEGTEDGVVIADAVVLVPSEPPSPPASKQAERAEAMPLIPVAPDQQLRKSRLAALKKEISSLEADLKEAVQNGPSRPIAMVAGDDSDAGDVHVAIRGIVHNRGPVVKRGVMQVASNDPRPTIADGESGRRELANWIASEQNPLTARVMANRVWHWLMGRGIVESVDNFGSMGTAPTHPELLDYLAASFITQGWSTKSLIREIMLSKTYRLGTDNHPDLVALDPENRMWWRMNRKRLRAEDIRDTLLLVGGTLDEAAGGFNIRLGTTSEYDYQFETKRRSVYVPVFRNRLPEIFEVFDFADPNIQRGSRTTSTIASQALLMMNHPMVIEQSRLAAQELLKTHPGSESVGVETAYLQVLGRPPTSEEREIAIEFTSAVSNDPESRWALLYQTLFESADFRYLN